LSASQQAQVQSNIGLVPTQATNITTAGYVADARAINTLNSKVGAVPSGSTVQGQINTLSDQMATIDSNTVGFWSTLSTQKYQGNYFAQVYGNFKGKTLTLTGATVYNGTASYNILSTSEITKINDFCVNITTTSDSVGGTPFYVTFSVS
jgi:hypothetical protein